MSAEDKRFFVKTGEAVGGFLAKSFGPTYLTTRRKLLEKVEEPTLKSAIKWVNRGATFNEASSVPIAAFGLYTLATIMYASGRIANLLGEIAAQKSVNRQTDKLPSPL